MAAASPSSTAALNLSNASFPMRLFLLRSESTMPMASLLGTDSS